LEEIQKSARLPADAVEAGKIAGAPPRWSSPVKAETQRMGPPPLYDLTELQRHANRFLFSAQHTLDTGQALYERIS